MVENAVGRGRRLQAPENGTLPTHHRIMAGGSERLAVVSERGAVGLSPGCRVAEQPLKQSAGVADFFTERKVYCDRSSCLAFRYPGLDADSCYNLTDANAEGLVRH
jgi:hypothetical protein